MRLHLNWKAFGAAMAAGFIIVVAYGWLTKEEAAMWSAFLTTLLAFLGFGPPRQRKRKHENQTDPRRDP